MLRYWESEFPTLSPKKTRNGARRYRQKDIEEIVSIKSLLYQEGFKIAGARKQRREAKRGRRRYAGEPGGAPAGHRLRRPGGPGAPGRGPRPVARDPRPGSGPPTCGSPRGPTRRQAQGQEGGSLTPLVICALSRWGGGISIVSPQHPLTAPGFPAANVVFGRDVAQPGSALAWGARGREFESRRPDHFYSQETTGRRPR